MRKWLLLIAPSVARRVAVISGLITAWSGTWVSTLAGRAGIENVELQFYQLNKTNMKYFFRRHRLAVMSALIAALFSVGSSVHAATTIGTNISTGGTLSVTGSSTLSDLTVTGACTGCGGSPAGSNGQIQVKNAGAFGASANLTFNDGTDGLTILHGNGVGFRNVNFGEALNVVQTTTDTASHLPVYFSVESTPTGPPDGDIVTQYVEAFSLGSQNMPQVYASLFKGDGGNTGTIASLWGIISEAIGDGASVVAQAAGAENSLFNNSPTVITKGAGTWNYLESDGGTIALGAGTYNQAPVMNAGTLSTYVGTWNDAVGGLATNAYPFWSDEQGVFRIKADNTFNGVYQAIPALYNPQFTKYTPGAINYERVVLGQWNSNVAEIGTQAGGTGTLRPLRLLGSSVDATAYKVGGVAGLNRVLNLKGSDGNNCTATVTNGIITASTCP
jgi:hypothetical protein